MDNKDNNIEELEGQESENIDSNDSNDVDDSYIDDEQQQYYGQSAPMNNNYPIHAKSPSALQGKHRNLNPNNDSLARGIN